MLQFRKLTLSCALATSFAASAAQAQDCGEVTITEMDWASAAMVTAVAKFLMEEGYGCTVTTVPMASTPALASVAETGEPDFVTEVWANSAPAYAGMVAEGKIEQLTEVLSDGGVEAWWIPNYMLEEHPELATIEGILANPELVGGRFHNCPVGWTCKTVNSNMGIAAGFEEAGIEDFAHGSGETLAASIGAAYSNKEPWFGYYWAPTSLLGKYPMTIVDIGEHIPGSQECLIDPECADPVIGAFANSLVTTVVSEGFAAENAAVTDLMRNLSFTNQMMGSILAWQEDENASPEEAAVYFLSNNSDLWSDWISDEARANLSTLIK
jgi:glycine betaine/proline transport system substrate-binding protein